MEEAAEKKNITILMLQEESNSVVKSSQSHFTHTNVYRHDYFYNWVTQSQGEKKNPSRSVSLPDN